MAMNNNRPILIVRSVTNALRGQTLLEQYGISAFVQRDSAPKSGQGCGYGLKINGNAELAQRILNNAGIKVVEIQGG